VEFWLPKRCFKTFRKSQVFSESDVKAPRGEMFWRENRLLSVFFSSSLPTWAAQPGSGWYKRLAAWCSGLHLRLWFTHSPPLTKQCPRQNNATYLKYTEERTKSHLYVVLKQSSDHLYFDNIMKCSIKKKSICCTLYKNTMEQKRTTWYYTWYLKEQFTPKWFRSWWAFHLIT